jgi:hypothetical protein
MAEAAKGRSMSQLSGNHDSIFEAGGLCTAYHIPRESNPVPWPSPWELLTRRTYTDQPALSSVGLRFQDNCVALTGSRAPDRARNSTAGLHIP